jgi:Mrp family chromosome partitioning ATPase
LCDGVLLVFNSHKTTTTAGRKAVERLESVGAPIVGVILNGVDIRNPDYADYRSYYPSYYASVQEESDLRHETRSKDLGTRPQFDRERGREI